MIDTRDQSGNDMSADMSADMIDTRDQSGNRCEC